MPHVLLFGCDKTLVEELARRPGWVVALGEHVNDRPREKLPDPRQWSLIVDDCEKEDNSGVPAEEAESMGVAQIPVDDIYWGECGNAHGIRFCGDSTHKWHRLAAPSGHVELELHPVHPLAVHLADFVERFECRFRRGRLLHRGWPGESEQEVRERLGTRKLFQDAYKYSLIELCEMQRDWLFCIDVASAEARTEAILYLATRTVPKLWPEVYADTFQPRRVVALLERQAEVIARRRQEVEEIEEEIQGELAFYAPYTALTVTGDDALKDLVAKAFQGVFGGEVTDLDAELEEGEQKTLDLLIDYAGSTWFCEVRSRGDGNVREADLERFDANHERATERHGSAGYKLLVFNGMYRQPADVRQKNPPFRSTRVVEEAEDRGICLLSAQQLLQAIEASRNGELTSEEFCAKLTRPGVADLPGLAA